MAIDPSIPLAAGQIPAANFGTPLLQALAQARENQFNTARLKLLGLQTQAQQQELDQKKAVIDALAHYAGGGTGSSAGGSLGSGSLATSAWTNPDTGQPFGLPSLSSSAAAPALGTAPPSLQQSANPSVPDMPPDIPPVIQAFAPNVATGVREDWKTRHDAAKDAVAQHQKLLEDQAFTAHGALELFHEQPDAMPQVWPQIYGAAVRRFGKHAIDGYGLSPQWDPNTNVPGLQAAAIAGANGTLMTQMAKDAEPNSPLGKLRADFNADRITPEEFHAGVLKETHITPPNQVSVQVGSPKFGPIPEGQMLKALPDGSFAMVPVPGSPAAIAVTQKQEAADTTSDVVTNAYETARGLIGTSTTGLIGQGLSVIPPSAAAELRRQTAVLKSNASISALNAMRAQSKTGGALGNVTEKEEAMLSSAAGALDPNAGPEQYARALDNYQHTLLRIVNGPEAGDRMWQESQGTKPTGGDTNDPLGIRPMLK